MKNKSYLRSFMNRKRIALLPAVVLLMGATAEVASAKTAGEINASVNACLDRFYKQVSGNNKPSPPPAAGMVY